MRGLSFSATHRRRSTDRPRSATPPSSSTSSSTAPASSAASASASAALSHASLAPPRNLIKRLSTTLRRRSSPPDPLGLPPRRSHDPATTATTATRPPAPALAPRATTFSVPDSRAPPGHAAPPTARERDIPFFADPARPDRAKRAVAVVRGRPPAWTPPIPPPPPPPPPASPSPQSQSAVPEHAVLRDANHRPTPHTRSFSVDPTPPTAAPIAPRARSMSAPYAPTSAPHKPEPRKRGASRWPMPPAESPARPRLFTPPAGTPLDRVTARRDRTEARVLVSACTFLEAEIGRMRAMLKDGGYGPVACCCKRADAQVAICECGLRGFVGESMERLHGVLRILEERYESIEQVYVKSEEYAIAMGKFFEVSPHVINKLAAGHRDLAGRGEKNRSFR